MWGKEAEAALDQYNLELAVVAPLLGVLLVVRPSAVVAETVAASLAAL